jgi:hypothetical protein
VCSCWMAPDVARRLLFLHRALDQRARWFKRRRCRVQHPPHAALGVAVVLSTGSPADVVAVRLNGFRLLDDWC